MKCFVQHLEDLLIQYECVIVPSLGGFIIHQESSYIRNNQLFAPSSQIRFNQLLTYHDGLLVESYMKEENISYSQAIKIVTDEVNNINANLNKGNSVILGRIGVLAKSSDGKIYLRNNSVNFLPDNLGLPIVNLKVIEKSNGSDNKIVLNIPKVPHYTLKYASAFALLCIFSLFIPVQIKDSSNKASISFESIKNIDFNHIEHVSIPKDTIASSLDNSIIIEKDSCYTKKAENKYHFIIASLPDHKQALEYISNQTFFPKEEIEIIHSKGRYRISAKSFSNYNKALSYMNNTKKKGIAKSAWILCK